MDSLTQVILGAACGELVLGRKIGNRALVWGAVGGTIPDLDVFVSRIFDGPVDALAFHRGPMHSILFAVLFPLILGPVIHYLYRRRWFENKVVRWTSMIIGILLFLLAATGLSFLQYSFTEKIPWVSAILLFVLGIFFFRRRIMDYIYKQDDFVNVSWQNWSHLFFWSIFTHPLLDTLTSYGTLLMWPFNNIRYAVSNISIVDPIYTVPFGLCLLAAALYMRTDKRRLLWTLAGVLISCTYLFATLINKYQIDKKFEYAMKKENIEYDKFATTPTIMNNILWYGVAKSGQDYYYSYYSLFDKIEPFSKWGKVEGRHELMSAYVDDHVFSTLKWFSDGYYSIYPEGDGGFYMRDLRYGGMNGKLEKTEDFIFQFRLGLKEDGSLALLRQRRASQEESRDTEWFRKRLKGF